ncbi:MAG TPA: IS21-like element helper ATPase IstB [Polyangiaceae bacterium]|nr:IS21-like element helper ATPase IstB [Polyangiaceae bacterium]
MLREPTLEKLQALRLRVLAATWLEQDKTPDILALPFDDRLALLVDAESLARDNTRLTKNLRDAKLRIADACIEGIDFPRERQLEKSVVRQLATCRWVAEHQTVIVTGATGTGKSYVACALAHQACRKGLRALYRRVPRLFDELRLARADGTYERLLARFAKIDVLVLDDFAISSLTEDSRSDLLEILEDRYARRATVITSQLKHDRWHDYLADPTVADAICDRVLHGAHKLALEGPSRRKVKGNATPD